MGKEKSRENEKEKEKGRRIEFRYYNHYNPIPSLPG
jgi:hypothetical protein